MNGYKKKALPVAISVALGTGIAGAAHAGAPGWYAGLGVGASMAELSDSRASGEIQSALESGGYTFNNGGSSISASTDSTAFAWKVYGGYQLSNYFALEAAYVGLGSVKAKFTGTVDGPEGAVGDGSAKASGIAFWGVGIAPIGKNFSVFAKIGGLHWKDERGGSATVGNFSPVVQSLAETNYGTDVCFGLGASYDLTNHIGFRLEWERYRVDTDDRDMLSAGARWKF